MSSYAEQYEKALIEGKSKIPAGEEYKGMVLGVEEFTGMQKFLREKVFGWLINILSKQPQSYVIFYSDKTIVFMGYKQSTLATSFEPEFTYTKPVESISMRKGLGQYSMFTEDQNGKKLKIAISSYGDAKKDLDYLAQISKVSA